MNLIQDLVVFLGFLLTGNICHIWVPIALDAHIVKCALFYYTIGTI